MKLNKTQIKKIKKKRKEWKNKKEEKIKQEIERQYNQEKWRNMMKEVLDSPDFIEDNHIPPKWYKIYCKLYSKWYWFRNKKGDK